MALEQQRVARALNERFTIGGYNATEVIAAYFGFYYGVAFGGWILGTLILLGCILVMKYAKRQDPRFLEIILRAKRFRPHIAVSRRSLSLWYTKNLFAPPETQSH